eukprot:5195546-Prymnesium_polylepis.1
MREQRQREWAKQSASLRRLRSDTAPRVDDRFSSDMEAKIIAAAPLYVMMAEASVSVAPPTAPSKPRLRKACSRAGQALAVPRARHMPPDTTAKKAICPLHT